MIEWRRSCVAYQKALHADPNYRQAAQEYYERQSHEPQGLLDWWAYREIVLQVGRNESPSIGSSDERLLLIKQFVLRRERSLEKMRREVEALENYRVAEDAARVRGWWQQHGAKHPTPVRIV